MQSEFNKLCSMYADREYTGHIISLNNVSHSKIRNLEIVGETKEFGEGDKSPDNPYELVSSSPELNVCGDNLYKPVFGSFNENIKFDGEWFTIENVTNTGSSIKYLNFYTMDFSHIIDGEIYTVIGEILEVDISENTSHINFAVTMDYAPPNEYSVFGSMKAIKITAPSKIIEYKEANIEKATLFLRSFISVPSGGTINKLKWRMAVYKGNITEENYAYRLYTEQNMKMISRNIFNINSEVDWNNNVNIQVTDNSITVTNILNKTWASANFLVKLVKGEKYTFSCSAIPANAIITSPTIPLYNKETGSYISSLKEDNNWKVTLVAPCEKVWIRLHATTDTAAVNSMTYSNIQIERNDIATEYIPYKDNYVLNSVGDVTDTYNPLTGEYVQRVGKLVLDGSESWIGDYEANGSRRFYIRIQGISVPVGNGTVANICCTHYEKNTANNVSANLQYGCGVSTGGNLSIRDNYTNTDDFKSYLQEQYANGTPVTVYYELAEPVTTIINKVPVLANIPDTTMYIEDNNNLGSIRTVLQTKGQ